MVDSLKNGLLLNEFLVSSWIKVIEDAQNSNDFNLLDIIILILAYDSSAKKRICLVLKKKVNDGILTGNFLSRAIDSNRDALSE